MSDKLEYKFISIAEWDATEEVQLEDGTITSQYTCTDRFKYQDARVGVVEVVISCRDEEGTHTRDQALNRINTTWPVSEEL